VDDTSSLPLSIALAGVSNLRDLGGWPTANGSRVRFGEVFRSSAPVTLHAADAARLAALGLRTAVDLRSDAERAFAPLPLAGLNGVHVEVLPIDPSLGVPLHSVAAARDRGADYAMDLLRHAYTCYALEWSHQYARLFELLEQPECRPLLFFCSAGKDRTGFGAALLLAALGVGRDAIQKDYLQTNRLWQGDDRLRALLPPAVARVLLAAHGELLDVAFMAMRSACGSVAGYLEQRLGLDATRRQRLRRELLTSAEQRLASSPAFAADGEQAAGDDHRGADEGPEVRPGAEYGPAQAG
jgi:protein-tyrosine phosphatase